jgi:hypothetical protein
MEKWNIGRIKKWNDGIMEEWNDKGMEKGIVEEWKKEESN